MSYLEAAATELVATHCAVCALPLVDAISVETGVGPTCRKKHGFNEAQGAPDWDAAYAALEGAMPDTAREWWRIEARKVVNVLVHRVAVQQDGTNVAVYTSAIGLLGFRKFAEAIAKRVGAVRVEREGDELLVRGPFNEAFVTEVRRCRGQFYDRDRKARVVPASERESLWVALKRSFQPGTILVTARGLSVL